MKPIPFGKYTLLERISHGGMAEVFRARTTGEAGFERIVAIKVLLPAVANDQEFVTMLIDEAKIAGQLSHANIAQIFDLGEQDGRYYIVQEYVRGRDLRSILRQLGIAGARLSVAQSCHVLLKMCEGLDYAHNKRDASGRPLHLVHRDISPQNILISDEGEVKLIDFGIVKAEGRSTTTLAGLVKGKFAYMSPEQIRGLPVDRRSDVFACGIILHELLANRPLFRRKSEFETLTLARNASAEPPSRFNGEVPPELDEVVLRALARHVEDRYQSALELRDALWAFVHQSGCHYTRGELSEWTRALATETASTPAPELVRPGAAAPPSARSADEEPTEDDRPVGYDDADEDEDDDGEEMATVVDPMAELLALGASSDASTGDDRAAGAPTTEPARARADDTPTPIFDSGALGDHLRRSRHGGDGGGNGDGDESTADRATQPRSPRPGGRPPLDLDEPPTLDRRARDDASEATEDRPTRRRPTALPPSPPEPPTLEKRRRVPVQPPAALASRPQQPGRAPVGREVERPLAPLTPPEGARARTAPPSGEARIEFARGRRSSAPPPAVPTPAPPTPASYARAATAAPPRYAPTEQLVRPPQPSPAPPPEVAAPTSRGGVYWLAAALLLLVVASAASITLAVTGAGEPPASDAPAAP